MAQATEHGPVYGDTAIAGSAIAVLVEDDRRDMIDVDLQTTTVHSGLNRYANVRGSHDYKALGYL